MMICRQGIRAAAVASLPFMVRSLFSSNNDDLKNTVFATEEKGRMGTRKRKAKVKRRQVEKIQQSYDSMMKACLV
jgi:hypothetical protein